MAFVGFWWLLVASGSCCSLLLVFAGFCWLLVTCVDFRRLLLAFVAFCFCGCSLSLLCLCDAGRKKGREGRKEGKGRKEGSKKGRKEGEHLQVASLRRNNYHFGDTSLREGAHNRTRKKIPKKNGKILKQNCAISNMHESKHDVETGSRITQALS